MHSSSLFRERQQRALLRICRRQPGTGDTCRSVRPPWFSKLLPALCWPGVETGCAAEQVLCYARGRSMTVLRRPQLVTGCGAIVPSCVNAAIHRPCSRRNASPGTERQVPRRSLSFCGSTRNPAPPSAAPAGCTVRTPHDRHLNNRGRVSSIFLQIDG